MTVTVRVEHPNQASTQARLSYFALAPVRWFLRALVALAKWSPFPIAWVFALTSFTDVYAAPLRPPRGTLRVPVTFDGPFRGEWLYTSETADAMQNKDSAILYMHGGGFIACGLNTHRRLVAKIGRAAGMPVFQIAYRQLPKAHLLGTIDDCVHAYQYLLDQGFPADRIVLAGDSAGGGLSFLLALACRERGLPMPAGIAALSPWGDLDNDARLAHPNATARRDAYIPTDALGVVAHHGFAVDGVLDEQLSPAKRDLIGLPPVLIQVGSTEILLSDAERLAQRCQDAGVPCTLQIWDRVPHVFQAGSDVLPEGREAIHSLGLFARNVRRGPVTDAGSQKAS